MERTRWWLFAAAALLSAPALAQTATPSASISTEAATEAARAAFPVDPALYERALKLGGQRNADGTVTITVKGADGRPLELTINAKGEIERAAVPGEEAVRIPSTAPVAPAAPATASPAPRPAPAADGIDLAAIEVNLTAVRASEPDATAFRQKLLESRRVALKAGAAASDRVRLPVKLPDGSSAAIAIDASGDAVALILPALDNVPESATRYAAAVRGAIAQRLLMAGGTLNADGSVSAMLLPADASAAKHWKLEIAVGSRNDLRGATWYVGSANGGNWKAIAAVR